MQIKKIILILFIFATIFQVSLTLTPFCNSIQYPTLIPLVLGETFNLELDNFFAGNNLDFSLPTSSQTTKLNKKIEQTDSKVFSFPNIIHQSVQQKDSQWGKQTSILYRNGTKTYLTFGIYSSNTIVDKSSTVLVSDEEDVICFNSVLFPEQNISIVDCMKKRSDFTDNYFYYIDTQKLNVLKTVRNSMYYSFTNITKREMFKMRSSENANDYLVRSYFSDGVESQMSAFAYVQIYKASNPLNLTVLKLLDKHFFNQTSLNITMAKSVKGKIYVLDSTTGLFEINIVSDSQIKAQAIQIKGLNAFDVSQSTQAAVFAKDENIYESNILQYGEYQITGKYSSIGFGNANYVLMNNKFVVFLVKNSNSASIEIFRKGAGYYSNAFTFMTNLSRNTQIYLHKNSDILQITSESKITLHQLSLPRVTHQFVSGREGTIENVTISAQSKSFNSTQGEKCQMKYQLKIVSSNDQIMLKSNNPASKKYFKNKATQYESGFLKVDLNKYFYGTNISYGINIVKSNSPSNFIEKINQRSLLITDRVKGNFIFVKIGQEFRDAWRSFLFVQTSNYEINNIECVYSSGSDSQSCDSYPWTSTQLKSPIRSLVTLNRQMFAVTQQTKKNQIIIHHTNSSPDPGVFLKYDNKIVAAITSVNQQLYVLKSDDSVIDVYDSCYRSPCNIIFQINVANLSKSQTNALDILADKNHPSILFLKYPKSILVVDSSRSAANILIAEIQTKQTSSSSFSFLVNKNKLIIVSSSNTISVYSLDLLKRGQVTEEKKFPLYVNNLYSFQNVISSNEFLYVPTVNPKSNSTSIFVYKLNTPATLSLYASFDLPKNFSSSKLQMSVNYRSSDRLIIANGLQNLFYEIFYEPKAVFTEDINQKFQLTFSNSFSNISQISQTCEIEAVSNNSNFKKTKDLDSFVKETKIDKPGTYSWNDRKWFEGNILDYNYTCEHCKQNSDAKVSFRSHNGELKSFNHNYSAFFETSLGSVCLTDKTLFKLNRDLTVRQQIKLPKQKQQQLTFRKIVSTSSEDVIVAILTQGLVHRYVSLIFTTKVGNISKTSQSFITRAGGCQKAEIVGDLLMVQESYPYGISQSKPSVYLFDLKMERAQITSKYNLIEAVEVFNQNYLKNILGYNRDQVWITGSSLIKLETNIYRLYASQVKGGLFIIDFSYKVGQKELNIIKISFEDLNVVIEQNNLSLPSDGYSNSIDFISSSFANDTTTHSLLICYNQFDNLIFSIGFDKNNKIIKKQLKSLLQHYDNYVTGYYIKVSVSGDFVGISYYEDQQSQGKKFIAIYDISNFSTSQNGSYSKKYIFTSITNDFQIFEFDFNKTQIQISNGKSTGLIVWTYYGAQTIEQKIYKNLELTLKQGYKKDSLTLIPWKYNQAENITLPITASAGFPNSFLKGNLQKQALFDQ